MKILAIESSCDETAAAVVQDGRQVLSNVIATSLEEHKLYGGVVPEIASRRHAESISGVVRQALADANCDMSGIDAIAVTYAPGLIGALLVGVNFAKGLSMATNTPLVPVHHLRSHVAANYITGDLQPPFLCLVVSGGHSHIVAVEDYTTYKVLGKTRDDAAGEALDKAGRTLGLPYPGGISIDKIAPTGDENAFAFPHPRLDTPYDFSFSGLKTAVINIVHRMEQNGGDPAGGRPGCLVPKGRYRLPGGEAGKGRHGLRLHFHCPGRRCVRQLPPAPRDGPPVPPKGLAAAFAGTEILR